MQKFGLGLHAELWMIVLSHQEQPFSMQLSEMLELTAINLTGAQTFPLG